MKLVASAIVRNERGRYLEPWLDHLSEFCDEIRIYDDASDDGTSELLHEWFRGPVFRASGTFGGWHRPNEPTFDVHEGRARQELLEWTLASSPTHVITLDADEFVTDGPRLRLELERTSRVGPRARQGISAGGAQAWAIELAEVRELDGDCICVRTDGHWRPYPATLVYSVPDGVAGRPEWRIPDKQLACGRTPAAVRSIRGAQVAGVSVLHFGWANASERQARFDRYMRIDGGRFHDIKHLESCVAPDHLIELVGRPWPPALEPYRAAITASVARG